MFDPNTPNPLVGARCGMGMLKDEDRATITRLLKAEAALVEDTNPRESARWAELAECIEQAVFIQVLVMQPITMRDAPPGFFDQAI